MVSTACASIVHGPQDTLFVDSAPAGAAASIDCERNFRIATTTPAKLVFPRKLQGCALTVQQPGYRSRRIELDQSFSGWFWTNFATGPLLALAVRSSQGGGDLSGGEVLALLSPGAFFLVDHLRGSKHDYEPKEIMVTLEPEP